MLRRMWKTNVITSVLFMISFTVSFLLIYYGMSLLRQFEQIREVREASFCQDSVLYQGSMTESLLSSPDLPIPKLNDGTFFLEKWLPIGDSVVSRYETRLILSENEPPAEPLAEGTYTVLDDSGYAQCVIGDAWASRVYKQDGKDLILVYGEECQAIGILKSDTFAGGDKRLFLFWSTMPDDFRLRCLAFSSDTGFHYRSREKLSEEDREAVFLFAKQSTTSDTFFEDEPMADMWDDDAGYELLPTISLYKKICLFLISFCLINCAALSFVWGIKHSYEYMVKLTYGFGRIHIYFDILKQLLTYEGCAAAIALGGCLCYELIRGSGNVFFQTLSYGAAAGIGGFIVFSLIASVMPMFIVLRLKPSNVLKCLD